MTIQEAQQNIGQPFRVDGFGTWFAKNSSRFDTIRAVNEEGWIVGDFIDAPAQDCRLKEAVPEQFKKQAETSL